MTLALATSLLGMAGLLALDVARIDLAQGRLQAAVDAAALAVTRDVASVTLEADARLIFEANLPRGYLGLVVEKFELSTSPGADGLQSLSLDVEASIPSAVLAASQAFGFTSKQLAVHASVARGTRTTELVMVLDNTGSMSGQPIQNLRSAARELSDILFKGQPHLPGLYVGIVPYVATVNIGKQHLDWILPVQPGGLLPPLGISLIGSWQAYAPTSWKGCVMAQLPPFDMTDDTILTAGRFYPFYWASVLGGLNVWPVLGKVLEVPQRNDAYGPNLGCGPPITPLTSSRAIIEQAIDGLDAWNRGGTMANLGLVWGWRALSPKWRGFWRNADGSPISFSHPLDYDASHNTKVIVLMTDGQNGWYKDDYTAYGWPEANRMGTSKVNATEAINTRMASACTSLKNLGVVLFTITFGSVDEQTRTRFGACSSSPTQNPLFPGRKYFHAPTGEELRSAFSNIAGQLTELRLVK
ncbi:vWA domain-containing protein [Geminicoccus roseus]|uniref:hypothetical protein n=1 Tax=Geminicoccus roseus TaxID=404900 RepID=UPI0003F92ABC|nr:hypothetical protein [Geminicoccus roseus]